MRPRQHTPAGQLTAPPRRDLLRGGRDGIPFVTDFSRLSPGDLFAGEDGRMYLPLAPVLFDPGPYLEAAEDFVRRVLRDRPEARIVVGLGNPGHFGLVSAFAGTEAVGFFIDYGLYVANRRTRELLPGLVPRLAFYYPWVEDPEALPAGREPYPPAGAYGDFEPPLFTSRVCVWRHGLRTKTRCASCTADRTLRLTQGARGFVLRSVRIAGSCLNLLFRDR
jgi:hypothetical protein